MSIEKLKATLSSLNLVDPAQKRGCTAEEIHTLEAIYGVQLPASYRGYLEEFGHGGADIFDRKEIDFDYHHVLEITTFVLNYRERVEKQAAEFHAKEDTQPRPEDVFSPLPDNVLFIANRYGTQFFYIVAEGGQDSAVYYYSFDADDTADVQEKVHDSVWDWLETNAKETRAVRDRLLGFAV